MQEASRYAIGLDIGTQNIRCVIGRVDAGSLTPTIVGSTVSPNNGMRKGVVVNVPTVATSIDKALEEIERMSGVQVNHAAVSINGSHITSLLSKGVIAVGSVGHEINDEDIARVEEAATVMNLPPNSEILDITPRSYTLDGQENIKDPIGMTGIRLEADVHVTTALTPHVKNLMKACEDSQVHPRHVIVAGLAAAKAVLTEQQMENGVVCIEIGGFTTGVVVFEDGDLQRVAVVPIGSAHITNDLAIGLKTDLDVAEAVKLQHATAVPARRSSTETSIAVEVGNQSYQFSTEEIDMIVMARLEEIFELVNKELKTIGRAAKLPGGAVLTGAGSQLPGLDHFARKHLQLSARIGAPSGFTGVDEEINNPEFATALGLMLVDLRDERVTERAKGGFGGLLGHFGQQLTGIFEKLRK